VLECFEQVTLRNLRSMESLQGSGTATVDVAAQLKEMW
jgi:hypothetical protein